MTSTTLQGIIDRYETTGEVPTDEEMTQTVTLPPMCLKLEFKGIDLATIIENATGDICVATPTGFVNVGKEASVANLAIMLAGHVEDEALREQVSMMWR